MRIARALRAASQEENISTVGTVVLLPHNIQHRITETVPCTLTAGAQY